MNILDACVALMMGFATWSLYHALLLGTVMQLLQKKRILPFACYQAIRVVVLACSLWSVALLWPALPWSLLVLGYAMAMIGYVIKKSGETHHGSWHG